MILESCPESKVFQRKTDFFLPKELFEPAHSTIKALPRGNPYRWVGKGYVEGHTFLQSLTHWRWLPILDDEGNICNLQFIGEKEGNDTVLLTAIAPFVQDGSFIAMETEDGETFRWNFRKDDLGVVRCKAVNTFTSLF